VLRTQAAGTGLKANPSLKNPDETQPGQHTLAQGWALKSNISQDHPLTKSRKIFSIEFYEEGEKTDLKANPENVAKAMTETLPNEDNERVFQLSDFLTRQQVASYFSRMPNLQENNVSI